MITLIAMGALIVALPLLLIGLFVRMTLDVWQLGADLFRKRQRFAGARLTADQAVALVLATIGDGYWRSSLVATLDEENGALIWRVMSMTIDMSVSALVDDASGTVHDVQHWSGWSRR